MFDYDKDFPPLEAARDKRKLEQEKDKIVKLSVGLMQTRKRKVEEEEEEEEDKKQVVGVRPFLTNDKNQTEGEKRNIVEQRLYLLRHHRQRPSLGGAEWSGVNWSGVERSDYMENVSEEEEKDKTEEKQEKGGGGGDCSYPRQCPCLRCRPHNHNHNIIEENLRKIEENWRKEEEEGEKEMWEDMEEVWEHMDSNVYLRGNVNWENQHRPDPSHALEPPRCTFSTIFNLKPDFLKIIRTVENVKKTKTVFTYQEACDYLFCYIKSKKEKLFENGNIWIVDVKDDPLGKLCGVETIHRNQLKDLMENQMLPIPRCYYCYCYFYMPLSTCSTETGLPLEHNEQNILCTSCGTTSTTRLD